MMRWPVMRRTLFELRWAIFWYGVGLGVYAALIVALYPMFAEVMQEIEYPEDILQFFGASGSSLASPSGFVTAEYQALAPLVVVIYAVVASTRLIAGEEGRGVLEMVMAQPIARTRLALEKMAGFLIGAIAICALVSLGWVVSVPFVDFGGELTLYDLFVGTWSMLPVVAVFGALGFLLGAIAPSRGLAAGVLTAVAIAMYLVASFARTVEAIAWLQYLSPYYYADTNVVLVSGVVWWHTAVLAAAAVLIGTLAVLAFRGREIGVRQWQPLAWARGVVPAPSR